MSVLAERSCASDHIVIIHSCVIQTHAGDVANDSRTAGARSMKRNKNLDVYHIVQHNIYTSPKQSSNAKRFAHNSLGCCSCKLSGPQNIIIRSSV